MIFFNLYTVAVYISSYIRIFKYFQKSESMKVYQLLSCYGLLVINFVACNLLLYIAMLHITFGNMIIFIMHVRLNQTDYLLRRTNLKMFNIWNLRYILKQGRKNVKLLNDINRIYGKSFFATLIYMIPSNALLVMQLLTTKQTLIARSFFFVAGWIQFMAIFAFQISEALISTKILQTSRRMHSVSVKSQKLNTFPSKWKLLTFVEVFHSENGPSATYGKFGKVTFKAIRKVCWNIFKIRILFYIKLEIFAAFYLLLQIAIVCPKNNCQIVIVNSLSRNEIISK